MTYRCDYNMLPQTFKSKSMSRGGFESHKMGLCGLFLCSSYTHYYMINIKTFLILILLLIIIVTVPLALEDLVPVLKSILQDESPVAIRQACSSLKVNTSWHLQTLHWFEHMSLVTSLPGSPPTCFWETTHFSLGQNVGLGEG